VIVRIDVLGLIVIPKHPALLAVANSNVAKPERVKNANASAGLPRITFDDKGCLMRGLLTQLRQEMDDDSILKLCEEG
jgi:hypothetical protein